MSVKGRSSRNNRLPVGTRPAPSTLLRAWSITAGPNAAAAHAGAAAIAVTKSVPGRFTAAYSSLFGVNSYIAHGHATAHRLQPCQARCHRAACEAGKVLCLAPRPVAQTRRRSMDGHVSRSGRTLKG